MKIAVPVENNTIFQHFGRTSMFYLYDIDETGKIVSKETLYSNGIGHGALADLLKENNVNIVICGGLGMPMYNHLVEDHMKVYGGCEGDADTAVQSFLDGTLDYDPQAYMHHGSHHSIS